MVRTKGGSPRDAGFDSSSGRGTRLQEDTMKRIAMLVLVLACGGNAESEEPGFGWCCDGICGLDEWEADLFEQCECPGGFVRPAPDTRGECLPLP